MSDYAALGRDLARHIPQERLITDPLRTLAYGTDASFYRLVPRIVARVENEAEVVHLLAACRAHGAPVTFRAAGTSLSGQAISDSVLCLLGRGWNGHRIGEDGATITVQPGLIGAEANRLLAPFGRKIGPDPASINAAKIGGIAANNASGMCCGTAQNSYRTLAGMRLVLADGTALDTRDTESRALFATTHAGLLEALAAMAARTKADEHLAARIRRKFAIKNTTGYSLNALIDFEDPIDILQHLMIGSEGTLGFISEITYRTVPDHAHKATALLLFADVGRAAQAVMRLKREPVTAVELVDRAGLRAVEDKPGIPAAIKGLGAEAAALLVDVRGGDADELAANLAAVEAALAEAQPTAPPAFTADPAEYERLWAVRKGLFPSVGAVRDTGTTVIIEDVAFPIEHLADATLALQALFGEHGYDDAILFGHALEGNLHFVFCPDFGDPAEVARYARFMDALAEMVVERFDGSLKAEHGTGRNMAPFVELEWGREATVLMAGIKSLLDPAGLLNPGVVLNTDAQAHLKNLKPLPAADSLVDMCTECGFCERMCPSKDITLTPRQRIVGWREIARLQAEKGLESHAREQAMRGLYDYHGVDTCAACGLCATACPVGIETGLLTKALRGRRRGPLARRLAGLVGQSFALAAKGTRAGLALGAPLRGRLGSVPETLPKPYAFRPSGEAVGEDGAPTVVYFPSCASRTMGPSPGDGEGPLPETMETVLLRAGFRVVYPRGLEGLCCGQPFDSKGFAESAAAKAAEVEKALHEASDGGALDIVCDTSPCSLRLQGHFAGRLRLIDVVEFLKDRVLDRLDVRRLPETVAVHANCSARRMGEETTVRAIAEACAETVVVPPDVLCCGFAGDKGFTTPELNAAALASLPGALPAETAAGYSTSRTCEIGLARHSGRPYRSLVHLVERASRPGGA